MKTNGSEVKQMNEKYKALAELLKDEETAQIGKVLTHIKERKKGLANKLMEKGI